MSRKLAYTGPKHARACLNCDKSFTTSYSKQVCCSRACTEAHWRKSQKHGWLISAARVRAEDGLDKIEQPIYHVCQGLSRCIPCRNAEKRLAHKQNRVPVYMQAALAAAGMGD